MLGFVDIDDLPAGSSDRPIAARPALAELDLSDGTSIVGMIADSVEEVIDLDPSTIEAAPLLGTRIESSYILGIGRYCEGIVVLPDNDRLFDAEGFAFSGADAPSPIAEILPAASTS